MTLDEQIEILQAAKEGKEIEVFSTIYNRWETKNITIDWEFNFICTKYRIKKQTKKVYLYAVQDKEKRISQTAYYYANEKDLLNRLSDCTIIKRLDDTELEINE